MREFVGWCVQERVSALTAFAFSTENWNRPGAEVEGIMQMIRSTLASMRFAMEIAVRRRLMAAGARSELIRDGIRVRILSSDPHRIPLDVAAGLRELESATAQCGQMDLNLCVSYGARGDIVRAARALVMTSRRRASRAAGADRPLVQAEDARDGRLRVDDIDETRFASALSTAGTRPPDLFIRTSEMRISNFLLWELAYSELHFIDKLWPEITRGDFVAAVRAYSARSRRYGR